MTERFHRQLKAALRAYPDQQRWREYVPVVLLGCHAANKEDLGYSPAEIVYGVPLSLPGQMLNPIDLTGTDPALYIKRLRFQNIFSRGFIFFRERTLSKPLSFHLTLVLTACFHILTNISPLTLVAKKKLYLLTG